MLATKSRRRQEEGNSTEKNDEGNETGFDFHGYYEKLNVRWDGSAFSLE